MKKMIFDFYWVFIGPGIAVFAVSLWNAIRLYHECRNTKEVEEFREAKRLLRVTCVLGALPLIVPFLSKENTVSLSVWIWQVFQGASVVSLMASCAFAWTTAKRRRWVYFTVSLWAISASLMSWQYSRSHYWSALRTSDPGYAQWLKEHEDDPELQCDSEW
jgi:hypothetical protein